MPCEEQLARTREDTTEDRKEIALPRLQSLPQSDEDNPEAIIGPSKMLRISGIRAIPFTEAVRKASWRLVRG